jgi:hypothetical protein
LCKVRERWHDNYYTMRDGVLAPIPYPVRVLVGLIAYRAATRTVYGQGILRFSSEEMAALRLEMWEGINALLIESRSKALASSGGDDPFWVLGGKEPTEADPVLFGFLAASLVCKAYVSPHSALKLCERSVDDLLGHRIRSKSCGVSLL